MQISANYPGDIFSYSHFGCCAVRLLPREQWPASAAAVLEEDVQEASPEDVNEEDNGRPDPNAKEHLDAMNGLAQVPTAQSWLRLITLSCIMSDGVIM